ncbi:unnamed protein product, partial [Chrysoparadoxa australica]
PLCGPCSKPTQSALGRFTPPLQRKGKGSSGGSVFLRRYTLPLVFLVHTSKFFLSPCLQAGSGSAEAHLVGTLVKEIKDEENMDEEFESRGLSTYKEIIKEKGFSIRDDPGCHEITLYKRGQGHDISITFDCEEEGDTEPGESEYDDEEEGDEEGMGEEEYPGPGKPFIVVVKKGGKSMQFFCTAADAVYIDSVNHLPEGRETPMQEGPGAPPLYPGPVLEECSGELVDALSAYLDELGVDDDMVQFIKTYSAYKEHCEYVHWLEEAKVFFKK